MEYSLNHLNITSNLKELTITQLINSLNLLGLEVDEFSKKTLKPNYSLENLKILLKIPSNREDLLIENFFLQEISLVFFFEIFYFWKKVSKNYNFLLKQKYLDYSNYSTVPISENLSSITTYAFELQNFQNHSSPLWIRTKLQNQGINSFNNFNDILNLVVLEWGQHFNTCFIFSSSIDKNYSQYKIERLSFIESYFDQNQKKRELPIGTIVMRNKKNEIITILGLLNTNLEENNKTTLLLELSFYDIQKNELDISLINPKVSLKYFRKMFLENMKFAFQRLLTFNEIFQYGLLLSTKYFTPKPKILLTSNKILTLKKKSLENILNIKKIDEKIFEQAGLFIVCKTKKELYFKISNARKDLCREIDLIEEYSRFLGYMYFEEIYPLKDTKTEKNYIKTLSFLKNYFLSYGFNEILSNSIQEEFENNCIQIENPLTKENSYLRTSLVPKLLDIFTQNLRSSLTKNNFFEIGRVFKKYKKQIIEENKLGAIFQFPEIITSEENSTEWFSAIGFIENILKKFGYEKIIKKKLSSSFTFLHQNRSVFFISNQKILGIFGEISPNYDKYFSLKKPTYFLELNLIYFTTSKQYSSPIVSKEYSKYPKITKDISCLLSKNTNFKNLKSFLEKNCNFLKRVFFFDIYFDKKNKNLVNIGLRFEFQSDTTTLTNEIIESELENIKLLLYSNFQSKMR